MGNKEKKTKIKLTKSQILKRILYAIVRIESIGMIAYSIVGLIINFNGREDSRYVFIMIQAVSLTLLTFVPAIVNKLFKVRLPLSIEILYLLFTTSALMLGEIFEFYIQFSWWDDLLHTFSGSFITVIGFIIIYFLNEKNDVKMKMAPGFIILFCFCLALACECVWETFEYAMDNLTGSNMQRYMDNYDNSIKFVGQDALADTMGDIIETIIGAGIFCIIGFIDITFRKKSTIKAVLKIEDGNNTKENAEEDLNKAIETDSKGKDITDKKE